MFPHFYQFAFFITLSLDNQNMMFIMFLCCLHFYLGNKQEGSLDINIKLEKKPHLLYEGIMTFTDFMALLIYQEVWEKFNPFIRDHIIK